MSEEPELTKRYFRITPTFALVQGATKHGVVRWLELQRNGETLAIDLSPGEWVRLAALIPQVPGAK